MKNKLSLLLLATCFSLFADLNSVTVPQSMVHGANPGLGLNYLGKVEYSLTSLAYDSIFVTLEIKPVSGGAPLTLTETSGDIGAIRINMNLSNEAKKYEIFFQATGVVPGQKYKAHVAATPFETPGKKKVESLIASLSKSQKASMMGGAGDGFENGSTGSVPRIYMADGPHGIRPPGTGGIERYATLFPNCVTLACTWDTALAYKQGLAKGEEWRAWGRNCSLGPALNIVYHMRGGRASEYGSEDPYLSGQIAAYDVLGLQSRGVIATIKHYACNQIEENRWAECAIMSERSLRELYLYNWMPSVVKGDAYAVMTAYNKVYAGSKIPSSRNKYTVTDVLRNEWGHRYLAMTDWGADMGDFANVIKYGVDIQMSNPNVYSVGSITSQSDDIINPHTRRILWAQQKIGGLESGYQAKAYANTLCNDEHRQIARDVGSAGMVLAKNTGNVLPLPQKGKKIAITGPFANQWRQGPEGSAGIYVKSMYKKTPLSGIQELLSKVGAGASTIVTDINSADYVVVFVGVTGEHEGSDRPSLSITSEGESAVNSALSAKPDKTIVVFTGGSAAIAGKWSDAPAVLIAFYPGMEQAYCIADVLFGNVNPNGKLNVTFPKDASQLPPFTLSGGDLNYPPSEEAHGYFRVNKKNQTPLFHFGHGLSYTTFSYSDLQVYPNTPISAGDRVKVRVKVTNAGTVAGKEVVQLYLSMPATDPKLPVRVQDLRGFAKVSLNSGASTLVDFTLTAEDMQVWDPGTDGDFTGVGGWKVLTGTYGVRVATSSQLDLPATLSVKGNFSVQ